MKKRNKKFKKTAFFLLIAAAVLITGTVFFESRMTTLVKTLAISRAGNIATVVINKTVAGMLSENVEIYNDLVKIEYDSNGKISAVKTDSIHMNMIKTNVSVNIAKAVSEIQESKISIAAGTLTGSTLLTGKGPKINLGISLSCSCNIEVKNSFEYSGINQTLHKVILEINTTVYVITMGSTQSTSVVTNIPIAETIIIGEIPEIYAGREDTLWQDLIN